MRSRDDQAAIELALAKLDEYAAIVEEPRTLRFIKSARAIIGDERVEFECRLEAATKTCRALCDLRGNPAMLDVFDQLSAWNEEELQNLEAASGITCRVTDANDYGSEVDKIGLVLDELEEPGSDRD